MKLIYLTLLVLPAALLCFQSANTILARAEEDELDDVVDIEGEDNQVVGDDALGEDDDSIVKSSQDVDTTILFIKPVPSLGDAVFDIQAGYPVEFLVGFINKGAEDYLVESMEASFRYPMDYTYYIQNFTALPYNREVKPKQEATFAYSFIPNEAFAGRPFGLNIQLNYRDASGNFYQEAVYNQTLNVVEVSEGLDGETFFLYVFLGAACVLALVVGQQALSSLARRRSPRQPAKPLETGTANDVDYDWLPKEVVNQLTNTILVRAEEDELDDVVDIEGEDNQVVGDDALGEDDDSVVKSSQDVDTTILFIKPVPSLGDAVFDIQAGYPVEFLVGFINKGAEDYLVESMEASFRYPMDYTYYIQNFTALPYNREVKPKQEATFAYSFIPNEAFAGRPFGLNIQLNYRDASGNFYQEAVYNQTLNVVEVSEGLDGETFFLYVFLGAACVLALVVGQQALSSLARRRSPRQPAKPLETGTANDVDYDWLPKEVVNQLKKSPKSPKQSPRMRKAKRSAGDD